MPLRFQSLPDELLHSVIDCIAYIYVPPVPHFKPQSRQRTFELFALSVANWRLRQICLPFLFARIKIRNKNASKELEKHLTVFSKFTKFLVIEIDLTASQRKDQIIIGMLHQFKKLLCVELKYCWNQTLMLKSLLAHPSVPTVVVHRLPDELLHNDDLSKVTLKLGILSRIGEFSLESEKCLDRGMKLACLELYRPDLYLHPEFRLRPLHGLKELRIHVGTVPISSSWLSILLSTHPTLYELWLLDSYETAVLHETTFISTFDAESQRQGFKGDFVFTRIGLRRAVGRSSQEWSVMGLYLCAHSAIGTSLVQVLTLVASSFPKVENLALDLNRHGGMYDIDDLASLFACFSVLRIVQLHKVFRQLIFEAGTEKCKPPLVQLELQSTDVVDEAAAYAESGLSQFVSLIAKQVRTLEFLLIKDKDCQYGASPPGWYVNDGWLQIVNRTWDVDGTLQYVRYPVWVE
ncbi:hypothetical protein C8R42DRAFT_412581 [Lentinula raphanica]|nr:hypothetical protein C8R42DRAFT_412581 [Lentinula raphanica]